jgi:hypothetical protein
LGAALEVAVRIGRLVEREYPVNHRPQAMQRDCSVHRPEISSAADTYRTERRATHAQQ